MPFHPRLIEPVDIMLPGLPSDLDGLRIAHVSDLHVHGVRRRHDRLIRQLAATPFDLLVLTGDYMSNQGQEPAAFNVLEKLCTHAVPAHGVYGVFGNHDTHVLRRMSSPLPIHWLDNKAMTLPGLPLDLLGFGFLDCGWADTLATLAHWNGDPRSADRARILLCHYPSCLPVAADLGVHLMLSGHTHGGQCRLPGRLALINSSDLPLRLTCGVLRHQETLCVVSRGLGEVKLPIRLLCPRQIPLLTLRRGPLLGVETPHIKAVRRW